MQDRRKRNLVIGTLCTLLVLMGIGYAVLSQILTIKGSGTVSGNWDIYITNIAPTAVQGNAVSRSSEVGLDKVSAVFEADLNAPADSVVYTVEVRNSGTIDAILDSVALAPEKSHEYIIFTTDAVEDTILLSGESMSFTVKVEFDPTVTNYVRQDATIRAITKLQLNFIQYTPGERSGGGVTPPVVADSNWTYEQIGSTNNYRITGYTGDFSTNTSSLTITPNAITTEALEAGDALVSALGIPNPGIAANDNHNGYAIVIPSTIDDHTITEIGSNVFNAIDMSVNPPVMNFNNFNITSVIIPEGITSTGDGNLNETPFTGTFLGNMNLTSVTLPSTLTRIGNATFAITGLTSVTLPSGLLTIGRHAFYLPKLTSITIPGSVTTIEEYAFQNNAGGQGPLQNLNFQTPSNLTRIGNLAFINQSLATLNIPSTVLTSIDDSAFYGNSLTTINFGALEPNVTLSSSWMSNQTTGSTPTVNWGVTR